MLTATQTTAAILSISSPSKGLENGTYSAKIVSNSIVYTNEFTTKKGDKMVIAQIKVAIDGQKPFNCAVLSYDLKDFCAKFSENDALEVYVSVNTKGYKTADC